MAGMQSQESRDMGTSGRVGRLILDALDHYVRSAEEKNGASPSIQRMFVSFSLSLPRRDETTKSHYDIVYNDSEIWSIYPVVDLNEHSINKAQTFQKLLANLQQRN